MLLGGSNSGLYVRKLRWFHGGKIRKSLQNIVSPIQGRNKFPNFHVGLPAVSGYWAELQQTRFMTTDERIP